MRTGHPHAARTQPAAPWGVRFPAQDGAGFHAVLHGAAFLIPANGAPVAIAAGDVVFLPHGLGHAIADTPTTPLVEFGRVVAGSGTGSRTEVSRTEMLCGAYGSTGPARTRWWRSSPTSCTCGPGGTRP